MSPADTHKIHLDPYDFPAIGSQLSDPKKLIQGTGRSWVENEILPKAGVWYEEGTLPDGLAK